MHLSVGSLDLIVIAICPRPTRQHSQLPADGSRRLRRLTPTLVFRHHRLPVLGIWYWCAFGGDAPASPADTYTFLITRLLPTGLKGLVASAVLAAAMFLLDLFHPPLGPALAAVYRFLFHDFMLTAFYMFLVCSAVMFTASRAFPEPPRDEARPRVWEDWREPLRAQAHGHDLGNYRILAAAVVVTFIFLYLGFA